jgi:DNA-binding XRE family transcriptional regulator
LQSDKGLLKIRLIKIRPCLNLRVRLSKNFWFSFFQKRRVVLDKAEFSIIRKHLGKTQRQISDLLGVSLKAVQSFEQGWRAVPVHVERQLFYLAAKAYTRKSNRPAAGWPPDAKKPPASYARPGNFNVATYAGLSMEPFAMVKSTPTGKPK